MCGIALQIAQRLLERLIRRQFETGMVLGTNPIG
jgi:hypothetical protein